MATQTIDPPIPTTHARRKIPLKRRDVSLSIASHENPIKKVYRDLKAAVRANWHDGYETHAELIGEIVVLLLTWQGEIFRSVIEKGERLDLAVDAMIAVSDWIDKMSRNEFHT
jgi:hypothetical protein